MTHSKKERRSVARDGPNPVDVHVGNRLRLRRTLLGMSQDKLGESLGVSFQQIQKYENGTNRIAVSRLYDLSKVLGVHTSYFFEELPEVAVESPEHRPVDETDAPGIHEPDPKTGRETLELARAYYEISDPSLRKRVLQMVKAVASYKAS